MRKVALLILLVVAAAATSQPPNGSTYVLMKNAGLVNMRRLALKDLPGLKTMPPGGVVQVTWQTFDQFGKKTPAQASPHNVTISDEEDALLAMQADLIVLQAKIAGQKAYILDLKTAKP